MAAMSGSTGGAWVDQSVLFTTFAILSQKNLALSRNHCAISDIKNV